jgi:plasmid maintenance system antidote protein VapI
LALSKLLHEYVDLSSKIALRNELAFGIQMDALIRMQTAYTVAQTRR